MSCDVACFCGEILHVVGGGISHVCRVGYRMCSGVGYRILCGAISHGWAGGIYHVFLVVYPMCSRVGKSHVFLLNITKRVPAMCIPSKMCVKTHYVFCKEKLNTLRVG